MLVLTKVQILLSLLSIATVSSEAFEIAVSKNQAHKLSLSAKPSSTDDPVPTEKKKENKAMAFLRKAGKIGGEANHDYTFATGVDEGASDRIDEKKDGKPQKMKRAYTSCSVAGVVDDMTEDFPTTSSGTQWKGFTDQVMGGVSSGSLAREKFQGRTANVLRGSVSLENNGGFIQMATNLVREGVDSNAVDASAFDGVELEVLCQGDGEHDHETFNVHLKTQACQRPQSSYRASFEIPTENWEKVRIPWSEFSGKGPGASETPFDSSTLTRVGVVAIGKEMHHVVLAISSFRFYSNTQDNPAP